MIKLPTGGNVVGRSTIPITRESSQASGGESSQGQYWGWEAEAAGDQSKDSLRRATQYDLGHWPHLRRGGLGRSDPSISQPHLLCLTQQVLFIPVIQHYSWHPKEPPSQSTCNFLCLTRSPPVSFRLLPSNL